MEVVFDITYDNSMTGIVSSLRALELLYFVASWNSVLVYVYLTTSADISFSAKNVRKLSFSLITPLGSKDYGDTFVGQDRHG